MNNDYTTQIICVGLEQVIRGDAVVDVRRTGRRIQVGRSYLDTAGRSWRIVRKSWATAPYSLIGRADDGREAAFDAAGIALSFFGGPVTDPHTGLRLVSPA